MTTFRFDVDGMTCDHCVVAVTSELQALAPDAHVEIDLGAPSHVTVTGPMLSAEQIATALDEAGGYTLVPGSLD